MHIQFYSRNCSHYCRKDFGHCPNPSSGNERRLRTLSKPFVRQPTKTSDNVRTLRQATNEHFGHCPNPSSGNERTLRTK
ncbi:MAG: hypothetical protein LBD59_03265 [Prevotellaceae bacterium]|nr:hypothetical protein [Prevotellaceae bacterium]